MTMTDPADSAPVGPDQDALAATADLLDGFRDPSRLAIVHRLLVREERVVDLTWHLGLAQSTVSKHLSRLRERGIVEVRTDGRSSRYALAHPDRTRRLLRSAAELLDLTGRTGEHQPDGTDPGSS